MKVKEESEKVGLKHNIQKTKIMASGPITSWQIHGETMEAVTDFIFGGSKITADGDRSHEIKRCLLLIRKSMTNLDSILKSCPSSQSYGFSSSQVWMWELDHKESWVLKNWCFWTVMLEKTLETPLDCKEIQPVNPKGNQSWMFIERTDVEAETPIFWPPHAKIWLIGKALDSGKDWRQEKKGTTEEKKGTTKEKKGTDGWMASPTWTWVWASSGSWWRTWKPGMLQSMWLQTWLSDWTTTPTYSPARNDMFRTTGDICIWTGQYVILGKYCYMFGIW